MSTGAVQTCLSCGRPVDATTRLCDDCRAAAEVVVIEPHRPAGPAADPAGVPARRARPRNDPATARAVGDPTEPSAVPATSVQTSAGVVLGEAFAGTSPARPGQRLAAFAIDSLAVVAGALTAFVLTRSALIGGLVLAELVVGLVVWEARTGRTVGNLALGLRAARVDAPFALGSPRAAVRALVVLAGTAVAGVGQWVVVGSTGFDGGGSLRQGWHDKVGRAVVVDVRAPRTPPPAESGVAAPATAGEPWVPVRPVPAAPEQPTVPPVPPAPASAPVVVRPATAPAPVAPETTPVHVTAARTVATGIITSPPGTPTTPHPGAPSASPVAASAAAPPVVETPTVAAPVAAAPTVVASPAVEPEVTATPTAAVPVVAAHLGAVEPGAGSSETSSSRTPAAPGAAAPGPAVPTRYLLTLDDGSRTVVHGSGVIGRSPHGDGVDHVVTIDDSTRSVSRTHAAFGAEPSGFWVQDAGSGNGTIVVLPDGRAFVAPPESRTPVPPGATVRLGQRSFTVTEVRHAP